MVALEERSTGSIFWRSWMSVQSFTTIPPTVVEIFLFEPNWWTNLKTDIATCRVKSLAWLKTKVRYSVLWSSLSELWWSPLFICNDSKSSADKRVGRLVHHLNISNIGFCGDIHGPQRMSHNDFGDPDFSSSAIMRLMYEALSETSQQSLDGSPWHLVQTFCATWTVILWLFINQVKISVCPFL